MDRPTGPNPQPRLASTRTLEKRVYPLNNGGGDAACHAGGELGIDAGPCLVPEPTKRQARLRGRPVKGKEAPFGGLGTCCVGSSFKWDRSVTGSDR